MTALALAGNLSNLCRNYTEANAEAQELIALAEEKGAFWKHTE
jgi:hypothetical protein